MTILVTGGAGFIGSNLTRYILSATDDDVIVLDNLTYAANQATLSDLELSSRLTFVKGDIADKVLTSDLLATYQPSSVIHLAAETHVDRSINDPEIFIQTNVVGTHRLLQSTHDWWQKQTLVKQDKFRFIHVSTDEVYGSLKEEDAAFTEETPYCPNSPYAASKAASDHIARAYFATYKFPLIVTHCSNNYGPYQFPEKLIPSFVVRAMAGDILPLYGDGKNIRDWLHVDDHCRALLAILTQGEIGETYNIGGKNEMRNIDVVHALCDVLDKVHPRVDAVSYRTQIRFVADRLGHDWRYATDITKMMRVTEWAPEENFLEGLEKTVRWYIENPD